MQTVTNSAHESDAPATCVYVSHADSRELSVWRLDRDTGAMHLIQQVPVDGAAMPMALSPDRRFLFVSVRTEPFRVASFAVDAATGLLAPIGVDPLPDNMAYIATDRSGTLLLTASYAGSKLGVSHIGADGRVANAHQVIETKPKAHCILPAGDNGMVLAASLGGDELMQFELDASSGTLVPSHEGVVAMPEGSGPRHFALHPDARFVFVFCELDASVHVLARNPHTNALAPVHSASALPADFTGKASGAEIRVRPDGRFLYVSERGSDTLSAFSIDPQSGHLARIATYPTEKHPRGMNIDPSGRWLIAAGLHSDHFSVYAIDPVDGTLQHAGRHACGKSPNWIEFVELNRG